MATREVVDVLLIGSGAAGGAFAWSLSQVGGMKIVCLEQGAWDRRQTGQSTGNGSQEADEHFARLIKERPRQPGAKYFPNGYPCDTTETLWQLVLGHNVGGAMVHYGAVWDRLHLSDFMVRSLTGEGEDWPIRYADLAPYYDLNDNNVGVYGVSGNPVFPPRSATFLPTPTLSEAAEILREGCRKLDWHWWPHERAYLTVPLNGRNPNDPHEAKNRSDVVHWPEAIRHGVELRPRATVREITVNKKGLADGAVYYDAEGRLQEQKARLVVVACNGIGTPRLLLNSKSSRFPRGLANTSGMVGKCLMSHPLIGVEGLVENADASAGGATTMACDEFYDPKLGRGFVGGVHIMNRDSAAPVAVALGMPRASASTFVLASLEQGLARTGDALGWGRSHHAAFLERYRHTVGVWTKVSQLPEEENRVELHPTLTDDFGTPAPKVIYKWSENTQKLCAYAAARSKELLEASGATKITELERSKTAGGGWSPGHTLGTARMGTDPGRSVVDKWGRSHDVKNLFIIDGSVFASPGASTPTSTIQAIALRTADYIKTNARTLLT